MRCPIIIYADLQDFCRNKLDFYHDNFSLSKEDFITMIKKIPAVLGLKNENVKNTIQFYQSEFSFNEEDVAEKHVSSFLAFFKSDFLDTVS